MCHTSANPIVSTIKINLKSIHCSPSVQPSPFTPHHLAAGHHGSSSPSTLTALLSLFPKAPRNRLSARSPHCSLLHMAHVPAQMSPPQRSLPGLPLLKWPPLPWHCLFCLACLICLHSPQHLSDIMWVVYLFSICPLPVSKPGEGSLFVCYCVTSTQHSSDHRKVQQLSLNAHRWRHWELCLCSIINPQRPSKCGSYYCPHLGVRTLSIRQVSKPRRASSNC